MKKEVKQLLRQVWHFENEYSTLLYFIYKICLPVGLVLTYTSGKLTTSFRLIIYTLMPYRFLRYWHSSKLYVVKRSKYILLDWLAINIFHKRWLWIKGSLKILNSRFNLKGYFLNFEFINFSFSRLWKINATYEKVRKEKKDSIVTFLVMDSLIWFLYNSRSVVYSSIFFFTRP